MKQNKTSAELKRLEKLAKMWRAPKLSELTQKELDYIKELGKKFKERHENT